MHDKNTVEHYREREQRERTLAGMAISPGVAAMHRDLADHYRQLIVEATGATHRPSMPNAR